MDTAVPSLSLGAPSLPPQPLQFTHTPMYPRSHVTAGTVQGEQVGKGNLCAQPLLFFLSKPSPQNGGGSSWIPLPCLLPWDSSGSCQGGSEQGSWVLGEDMVVGNRNAMDPIWASVWGIAPPACLHPSTLA